MDIKFCKDCSECKKKKGVATCYEMWDKPISEISECPLGIESSEIETIEKKAKENKIKLGAKSEEALNSKKTRKPVVKKVSQEKKTVFDTIAQSLSEKFGENVEIANPNKLIYVRIGEKIIKIDIIETKKT